MKLFVSDYDDTLYINEEDIKKNIEVLSSFVKDNLFVVATGRSYFDYEKVKEKYHIFSHYVILNHGAILMKEDTLLWSIPMENEIKEKLLLDLELESATHFFGCGIKESRLDLKEENLTKIQVCYETEKKAKEIKEKIEQKYPNVFQIIEVCEDKGLEFVNKKAGKEKAILEIAKLENIPISNIYTIGNGKSDVEMVRSFHGFAIKDSKKEVKEVAEKEYSSVSELVQQLMKD